YAQNMQRYTVENLWTLPLEVAYRGGRTGGIIGPVFLFVPVALLALKYRAGRRLLVAGLIVLATYLVNVGTRFLIPALPFFSLAMAMGLSWSPPLLTLLM